MVATVAQPSLFGSTIVDEWRPEETLFSLASRQHVLSCHSLAADTCHALFGHARCGSAHDLPSRVDAFVERTSGIFGSAEAVIRERTILPFYLPYRSASDSRDAIASMRGDSIGALKANLGMLAGRFRAHHPLKACAACMKSDRGVVGTAHWRLPHQLPGVWVCPVHGVPLLQSTIKSTGVGRFLWFLPDEAVLDPPESCIGSSQELWRAMADCGMQTWALPKAFHFNMALLTATYRRAAIQRGIMSMSGRLKAAPLADAILAVTKPLSRLPELAALPGSADDAYSQFSRLLQQPRCVGHPLRHFALILVLFGSWDQFWAAYSQERPEDCSSEPSLAWSTGQASVSAHHERRDTALAMLSAGCSVSTTASSVGVTTATAMVWAAQASIPTLRRPKKLKPELRKQIVRVLRRGADKRSVAESFGVSVQTVTMTLRTEIGLSKQWAEARRTAAKRRARSDWQAVAARYAEDSFTEIRQKVPAAFAWLYRNDRAWLEDQSKQRPTTSRSQSRRVNWDERDQQYAQQVNGAALMLATERGNRVITIGMLCQAMPGLKALLGRLDRMPLTKTAVKNAMRRRSGRESENMDLL